MLNKRITSLLLSVLLLAGILSGCSLSDVQKTVETVVDVVEIIEEIDAASQEEAPTAEPEAESAEEAEAEPEREAEPAPVIDEDGSYTTAEDVALYIHTYGCLPKNFVTKDEAREAGWNGGGLEDYLPGKCIGGDYFGNREGLLPKASGRTWTECDINTLGADSRGAERIVFSNDGLIYYTGDHYESFELLYGTP